LHSADRHTQQAVAERERRNDCDLHLFAPTVCVEFIFSSRNPPDPRATLFAHKADERRHMSRNMAAEVGAILAETSPVKPFSYRRRLAYPDRRRALGKPMNFKRGGFVVLTMLSLWVAILFLFCVITALMKASQTLPDPWGTAFAFSCTAVYIALFVLLFFGLPELLLLLRLRELGLWTRVVVGGASSGFYLVSVFFKHVDIGSLIFVLLLGMAFGAFLWAPIYRLRGDNRRDWDQPMLGGRPPYSR
jgi:hypothetical protein